ncbi:MAG: methylmalonyl-CoA epimerase [Dehalococcoidia bacterium]|nr:methylmalonyl-CoA epimerase [Dehalococcoidia bacterium]HCV00004.1 methylmalonyl-CoA epimerase [Dehalococcoidia bacterium]|tara:strand:- start:6678 stop:7493 length:816 start_codon:yes stop_codon:yes gene_type:complete
MLSKVHHVGIVVRNGDDALSFYRDALGFPVSVDRIIEDQGVRGVLLPCGDAEIELLEPTRDDTGVARFLESRGEGMHHVCLESDDCGADLKAASDAGVQLIDEVPRAGLAGLIGFLHPKANNGVLIEYATPVEEDHVGPSNEALAQSIDHIGIVVKDIPDAVANYERNFGFPVDPELGGRVDRLGIENAFMLAGNVHFEFIRPLSGEGPVAKFAAERGEGSFLLSLAVADVSAAVDALRARGARVGDANGGVAFVSPRSSFGVNLQLIERS